MYKISKIITWVFTCIECMCVSSPGIISHIHNTHALATYLYVGVVCSTCMVLTFIYLWYLYFPGVFCKSQSWCVRIVTTLHLFKLTFSQLFECLFSTMCIIIYWHDECKVCNYIHPYLSNTIKLPTRWLHVVQIKWIFFYTV